MIDKKEELVKFSKWLRAQLLHLGMTARDLSILSGVDESEISKMTRAVRWPSLRIIKLVLPHLRCSNHDFLIAAGLEKGEPAIVAGSLKAQRLYTKDEVEAIIRQACQAALELVA